MVEWSYLDGSGQELGRSRTFEDVEAAEGWMSASWADLAEMGVEEVELRDPAAGARLYRMGLGAAS
jgi:hypothetical protein